MIDEKATIISQTVGIMNDRFTSLAINSQTKSQKTIETADRTSFFCLLVIVEIVIGLGLTYSPVEAYKSIFHFVTVNIYD